MLFDRKPASPPDAGHGDHQRVDAAAAAAVERGVAFYRTLGKTVASAYFKERQVPHAVVSRILEGGRARGA